MGFWLPAMKVSRGITLKRDMINKIYIGFDGSFQIHYCAVPANQHFLLFLVRMFSPMALLYSHVIVERLSRKSG